MAMIGWKGQKYLRSVTTQGSSEEPHLWVSSSLLKCQHIETPQNCHLFSKTLGNRWHTLTLLPGTRQLTALGQAFPVAFYACFSACTLSFLFRDFPRANREVHRLGKECDVV